MSNFLVLYLDSRGYMYTKGNIFINKFNYLNIKYSVLCKNKVIIQYFHFFFFFTGIGWEVDVVTNVV